MNAFDLEKHKNFDYSHDGLDYAIETTLSLIAESIFDELGIPICDKIRELIIEPIEDEIDLHSTELEKQNFEQLIIEMTHVKLKKAIKEIVEEFTSELELSPWDYYEFTEADYNKFRLNELIRNLDKTLDSNNFNYKS
jgi:hypothetical protein